MVFGSVVVALILAEPCAAQQNVTAPGGVAVGRDMVNSPVNIYGLTPEQVQDLTKAAVAGAVGPLTDRIVDLSSTLGVTQGAAVTMLRIIGQQDVPLEKLPQKLAEVAEQYKSAMERLASLDPQDPMTRDLIGRAAAAIKAGHLDDADQLVSQAEQAEIAAAHQAQQLAQQALAAADQRLLRAAHDRGVRGDIAMTGLHYLAAAQDFQAAVDLVPAGHPDEKGQLLSDEADALYRQGDERGDNAALLNSIATYRLALQEDKRDRVPGQWAWTQNGLGNSLWALGRRESGTARLEEAVAVYRAALEELTRERAAPDWAMIQLNLGSALTTLGERENGTAHLEQAVAAYRAALGVAAAYYAMLEEDSSGRVSWLNWATTQMNLGAALQTLGEREGGTARLEEAVTAYRAALEEYTPDGTPLQWAMTQNNLGNVLQTLGKREGSTAQLEEAVAAYRAALEKCTRDRLPLQWAATQNNLGTVLRTLGERESTTARLEEAVAAHRAALEEYTRDRAPVQWAMTQNNLGIALKTLGEWKNEPERLEEAVAAYRAALEEYTPDRTPLQWAQTQMNLGNALLRLGEREDGTTRLEQAVAVYRTALEHDPMPIDQANIEFNMGLALTNLGVKAHSTESLKEALLRFRQACEVFRAAGMMQLSIPCDRAISPLQKELEPSAPGATESPKPAG